MDPGSAALIWAADTPASVRVSVVTADGRCVGFFEQPITAQHLVEVSGVINAKQHKFWLTHMCQTDTDPAGPAPLAWFALASAHPPRRDTHQTQRELGTLRVGCAWKQRGVGGD